MSAPDRRAMAERPGVDLSVRRQCALLNLARSGVYRPKPVIGADDLALMRRIDELHLELPFYGSRRMSFELNEEAPGVNRKRVQLRAKKASPALMRVMGIEAPVPRPGTSKPAPGHKIYPYLLRHPLPDPDPRPGPNRDEPPRPGLQHQANDQDLRGGTAAGGDPDLIASLKPQAPIDQPASRPSRPGNTPRRSPHITRFSTASGIKSGFRRQG